MEAIGSIPIISSDGVIEIDSNDLPRTQDLLPLLKSARNPLSKWILLAKLYHGQGNDEALIELLESAISMASLDYVSAKADHLQALNMISCYYLMKANQSFKKEEINVNLDSVRNILSSSEVLANIDQSYIIGTGYLNLMSGKELWSQAEEQFKIILEQDSRSFVAVMGMAYLYMAKKEYTTALIHYRKALQICPQYANDARYGIGVCQYKLGRIEDAKNAFERTIAIDPNHIGALLALAIIKTTTFDPKHIKEAMGCFKKVYDINKRHPTSLNYLANHFFFNKDYEKAKQLAMIAFDNSDNDFSKSESSFQIGRVFHVQGNITEAFQNYHKSIRFNKSHRIASYNLGQIHISRKEYREAYEIFSVLEKLYPNDILTKMVTLYLSVILCKNFENSTIAIEEELKKNLSYHNHDIQLYIACADVLSVTNPKNAITYYSNAIKAIKKASVDVPFELYNNIAACQFKVDDYNGAFDHLQKAYNLVAVANEPHTTTTSTCEYYNRTNFNQHAALCRIHYNICRVHECRNDYQTAFAEYLDFISNRGIKHMDGKHADLQIIALAMIRIAHICQINGNDQEMINWVTCSRVVYKDNICASAYYIGNYYLERRDLLRAQKQFEIVLKMPSTSNDTYSLLALGNIWLRTASQYCNDPVRKKRLFLRALGYYKQVLALNPHNIYAANGVGCVLAYQDNLRDARDIFSVIRETDTHSFNHIIYINLGNVHFKLRHFIVSIQMFNKALEYVVGKSFDCAKINFFIARAYFFEKGYADCVHHLSIALHLFPDNNLYLYNMALALLLGSIVCIRDEKATVALVNNAIEKIKFSQRLFTEISEKDKFEIERCQLQIKICIDTLDQSQLHLQRATLKEKQDLQNKLKYQEALEEIRIRNENTKLEQIQLQEKKRTELEEKRKLYLQTMQSKLQSTESIEEPFDESIKPKKSRKSSNNDNTTSTSSARRSALKRKRNSPKKKYKSAVIVDDSSDSSVDNNVDTNIETSTSTSTIATTTTTTIINSTSADNKSCNILNDEFPMDDISSDSEDETTLQ